MPIRGLIFDLDGTLVDSGLDFEAMRREMNIPDGRPILEALQQLAEPERTRCRAVLEQHEREGAARARPMPGVSAFLRESAAFGYRLGIVTRNSRVIALETLACLPVPFDPVMGREDAPPKPDPTAIHKIREGWELSVDEVVMIGDYRFDLMAGRSAGIRTVLYCAGRRAEELDYHPLADFCLDSFEDPEPFFSWLGRESS